MCGKYLQLYECYCFTFTIIHLFPVNSKVKTEIQEKSAGKFKPEKNAINVREELDKFMSCSEEHQMQMRVSKRKIGQRIKYGNW